MEKENTLKLVSPAKEFNGSINTLIKFLVSKNFNCDIFKTGTKPPKEMYSALQIKFQLEKVTI